MADDPTLIRDEGAAEVKEKKDKDGTVTTPHQPARKAWPAGVGVRAKEYPSPDDVRQHTLYELQMRDKRMEEGGSFGETYADAMSALDSNAALLAVMLTALVGETEHFKDPQTGSKLDLTLPPLERIAAIQRTFPTWMSRFIVERVASRFSANPFSVTA